MLYNNVNVEKIMIEFINDEGDCVPVEPLLENITINLSVQEALLISALVSGYKNEIKRMTYPSQAMISKVGVLHKKIEDELLGKINLVPMSII